MQALILVDLQNDFLPGGALAVPHGDEVIPLANQLQPYFHLIVATQDWHPANHLSFASQHSGKRVGDMIELDGLPQVLWPDHCVQGSGGAELAVSLNQTSIARIFPKGDDRRLDSYSGFFDNGGKRDTGLAGYLRDRKIDELFILGLATDYCVHATALDAARLGFDVWLIEDACRGVDLTAGDCTKAIEDLRKVGVKTVSSDRWLHQRHDRVNYETRTEIPQGRFIQLMQSGRWEYAQRRNAQGVVVIVPITTDNEFVVIEQYREPLGKRCIEFPAGLVGDIPGDEQEESTEAVRRELFEETGFEAASIQFLASTSPSAGLTDEIAAVYLARGLHRVNAGGGAEGELIQVHLVPCDQIKEWLTQRREQGLDVAMSLYAGLWLAYHHAHQ